MADRDRHPGGVPHRRGCPGHDPGQPAFYHGSFGIKVTAFNGKQPGDPAKAAVAVLHLLEPDDPPTHLLLGTDALAAVSNALRQFSEEIEQYPALTLSTDYDMTA